MSKPEDDAPDEEYISEQLEELRQTGAPDEVIRDAEERMRGDPNWSASHEVVLHTAARAGWSERKIQIALVMVSEGVPVEVVMEFGEEQVNPLREMLDSQHLAQLNAVAPGAAGMLVEAIAGTIKSANAVNQKNAGTRHLGVLVTLGVVLVVGIVAVVIAATGSPMGAAWVMGGGVLTTWLAGATGYLGTRKDKQAELPPGMDGPPALTDGGEGDS